MPFRSILRAARISRSLITPHDGHTHVRSRNDKFLLTNPHSQVFEEGYHCQFCNMSLGFKVGEDEHAAYIAGFAGDCVSEFINSKNTD